MLEKGVDNAEAGDAAFAGVERIRHCYQPDFDPAPALVPVLALDSVFFAFVVTVESWMKKVLQKVYDKATETENGIVIPVLENITTENAK